ncbi:hypothetical protein FPQ18DRAFT_330300 [Pyronema domesticum]|nr:hypothetical protein FPQ18DRAFT_330300 [Pyronema domesticum]
MPRATRSRPAAEEVESAPSKPSKSASKPPTAKPAAKASTTPATRRTATSAASASPSPSPSPEPANLPAPLPTAAAKKQKTKISLAPVPRATRQTRTTTLVSRATTPLVLRESTPRPTTSGVTDTGAITPRATTPVVPSTPRRLPTSPAPSSNAENYTPRPSRGSQSVSQSQESQQSQHSRTHQQQPPIPSSPPIMQSTPKQTVGNISIDWSSDAGYTPPPRRKSIAPHAGPTSTERPRLQDLDTKTLEPIFGDYEEGFRLPSPTPRKVRSKGKGKSRPSDFLIEEEEDGDEILGDAPEDAPEEDMEVKRILERPPGGKPFWSNKRMRRRHRKRRIGDDLTARRAPTVKSGRMAGKAPAKTMSKTASKAPVGKGKGVRNTYTRKGKEREESPEEEEDEEMQEEKSSIRLEGLQKLKEMRRKFEEVDKWELEFETVSED